MAECVAVSEHGLFFVTGSQDKTIRVRDWESGKEICDPLEGHASGVSGVSPLSGVDCIVSCSTDRTVRLWNVHTARKKARHVKNGHKSSVEGVSFTPDGKYVVSGSIDQTLRIWDTTSGQPVGDPLMGPSNYISDLAVTRDGQHIMSVSENKKLRLWDLKSIQRVYGFTRNNGFVCVTVIPRSKYAEIGSQDQIVRILDLRRME